MAKEDFAGGVKDGKKILCICDCKVVVAELRGAEESSFEIREKMRGECLGRYFSKGDMTGGGRGHGGAIGEEDVDGLMRRIIGG